ncbi:MAG: aminopeptidase P family protein [Bacteroidales bacterium]|nr:aminopeptidase P family protein [Bacteroidales bacterium]
MFPKEIYINRRQKLSKALDGGFLLFIGNRNAAFNYPSNEYAFRQDSTFLYLFGIDEPDFAAVIADGETTIYADDVTMDDIIWMGPQKSVADKAAEAGISHTKRRNDIATDVAKAIRSGRAVHFIPPYRGETIIELSELTGIPTANVKQSYSAELVKALVALRSQKEPCEIEELERHQTIGYNMHVTAMKMAAEGRTEKEIHAAIDYQSMLGGGSVAFPTICSVSGQTLHNHTYNNILRNGQMLLVDAGSDSPLHYATDHTRTTPVGGRFTQKQKEIYQIVLNANNAVADNSKPGVRYLDMHLLAARTIADGLISLGIMKGTAEEAVSRGAHALFFPHGIGHMMGLDVHDMENYNEDLVGYDEKTKRSSQFGLSSLRLGRELKPGFVVTDEPGIYFIPELIDKWQAEGLFKDIINYDILKQYRSFGGIRLEDDLLVTDSGCRILGKRIPITIEEVEALH